VDTLGTSSQTGGWRRCSGSRPGICHGQCTGRRSSWLPDFVCAANHSCVGRRRVPRDAQNSNRSSGMLRRCRYIRANLLACLHIHLNRHSYNNTFDPQRSLPPLPLPLRRIHQSSLNQHLPPPHSTHTRPLPRRQTFSQTASRAWWNCG